MMFDVKNYFCPINISGMLYPNIAMELQALNESWFYQDNLQVPNISYEGHG